MIVILISVNNGLASDKEDSLIVRIENSFGDDKFLAQAEYALYLANRKPDSAINIANNVLTFTRNTQLQLKGLCYFSLGEAHFKKDQFQKALDNYFRADELFQETNDTAKLGEVVRGIGLIYYYQSKLDSAMIFFQKFLKYEKAVGNKEGVAKAHQNIGLIHFRIDKKLDKFYEHSMLALNIYEQLNDKQHIAEISNNIAIAYKREKKYDKAFSYYERALREFEKLGDELNRANVLNNIGGIYYHKREYDKAIIKTKEAIDIFNSLDDKNGLVHAHSRLGDIYFKKGQVHAAMGEYLTCEELNNQIGVKGVRLNNYQSLIRAYKSLKDYENALRVTEQYHKLKDSIFSEEKIKTVIELEKEYQSQKAVQDLINLKAKNKLNKLILVIVIIVAILGMVIVILWYWQKRTKENQRLINLEQKVLRTQMSPHFLFNALSAIQYFVLENKTIEAIDFIGDFSKLIRMVLQSSQEEFITLETEKEILENYLDLLSKRYDKRLKYLIHYDENIDLSKILIPPMLAQPFIENSIEHGELGKVKEGNIWISFSLENQQLKFRIQDDGIGIDRAMEKKNGSIRKSTAIRITQERLRLINSGSHHKYVDLIIEDLSKYGKNGTLVEFSIPYHQQS